MDYSIVTGTVFARHDCPGHPECHARLGVALSGVPAEVSRIDPRKASDEELARVHDRGYIAMVRERGASCPPGRCMYLDPDTYITHDSFEVARYAAGSAITAVEQARSGTSCFALVRPPGHHAGPQYAMGFCLFNNVAVAAAYAASIVDRVAIIDWDVHHGNGTQALVETDARIRYVSLHQHPWYPGTGMAGERGVGNIFNVPRRAGLPPETYVKDLWDAIAGATTDWAPEVILVSAGFDAMRGDPLGGFTLEPLHYAELTRRLRERLPAVPIVGMLEGGYDPLRLAEGVAAHVAALG
jgi:acetoin utilization deacetylase AcuC-like enzyme